MEKSMHSTLLAQGVLHAQIRSYKNHKGKKS